MTENKRFVNNGKDIFQYGEWWCSANGEHCADVIATAINELIEENEQLKKDATILIYSNQDYRQENENLKKQLDYIQNLISNSIEHQKTELAAKALKEIIEDYNEWMLGHRELKE